MTKIDLTLDGCEWISLGNHGDMTFSVADDSSHTEIRFDSHAAIRFDLGQRLVITRDERGFLRVIAERASDEPGRPT